MKEKLLFRIRAILLFFMFALALSGITAFPLKSELRLLVSWFGSQTEIANSFPGVAYWLNYIYDGLNYNSVHFPFMAYGTDWLAFSHLVIAIAFIGPFIDPVRNIWVVYFGMICCLLVFPTAFICGEIREIPILWRLIDCSFGFFGIFPLLFVWYWTKKLQSIV